MNRRARAGVLLGAVLLLVSGALGAAWLQPAEGDDLQDSVFSGLQVQNLDRVTCQLRNDRPTLYIPPTANTTKDRTELFKLEESFLMTINPDWIEYGKETESIPDPERIYSWRINWSVYQAMPDDSPVDYSNAGICYIEPGKTPTRPDRAGGNNQSVGVINNTTTTTPPPYRPRSYYEYSVPSWLIGVVAAAAMAVVSVSAYRAMSDVNYDEAGSEEEDTAERLGRIAGAAADRIEDSEAYENEVYRAWHEMTANLDVDDPSSTTPGEFAAAAIEAGIAREHVEELTRLFERVRYGDDDPEAHEGRAVDLLRRIEEAYA